MARGSGSKIKNVVDKSGLVDQLVYELSQTGAVRLVHIGLFRVRKIEGKKRYHFKARKVVAAKPYNQIIFTPAQGIRDMLREGKIAAARKVGGKR